MPSRIFALLALFFFATFAHAQDVRKGGSVFARVESNGDVRISGRIVGRIESDGDVRRNGTVIGRAAGVRKEQAAAIFFFGFFD